MKHKLMAEDDEYRVTQTGEHTIIVKPKNGGIQFKLRTPRKITKTLAKELLSEVKRLITAIKNTNEKHQ